MATTQGTWIAGIAGTVIAGVLIWYLTTQVLVPQPSPHVQFLSCSGKSTSTGEKPDGTFEVINSGTGNAVQCQVKWYPGPKAGTKIVGGREQEYAISDYFGLSANEKKTISLEGLPYSSPGTYVSYAHLICDRDDVTLNACALEVTVREKGVQPVVIPGVITGYSP